MRRRDAQSTHLFVLGRRPNGPTVVSVVVSAALHLLALALAIAMTVRTVSAPQLVRITLVPGGGMDAGAGAAGNAGSQGPAPAREPEQPRVAVQPAPAPPAPVAVPRPRPARKQRQTALAAAVADAVDHGAAGVQDLAATTSGSGAGTGSDTGTGTGTGAGTGSGLGTGAGGGDTRARCVYCPEPRYPLVARQRGWEGTVRVGLAVGSDGYVQTASLRQSSGYGALDDAAVAVARRSRFTPPETRGLPTPLHGHIEYRFQLSRAR